MFIGYMRECIWSYLADILSRWYYVYRLYVHGSVYVVIWQIFYLDGMFIGYMWECIWSYLADILSWQFIRYQYPTCDETSACLQINQVRNNLNTVYKITSEFMSWFRGIQGYKKNFNNFFEDFVIHNKFPENSITLTHWFDSLYTFFFYNSLIGNGHRRHAEVLHAKAKQGRGMNNRWTWEWVMDEPKLPYLHTASRKD